MLNYDKVPKGTFLPFGEAERYRLVEAAKSPTEKKSLPDSVILASLDAKLNDQAREAALDDFKCRSVFENGSKTIIQKRDWSDEYRIRTQVSPAAGSAPPPQSGDRVSLILSDRGARKIADACAYTASLHRGFKTFITGTFSKETRANLTTYDIKTARPYTTIQKEVTRTMDAMQKMYQRGWSNETGGDFVAGHDQTLAYCWVVEIPENEKGERNPHVHILVDWQVDFKYFKAWSNRLESLWGNGYFHLEKIHDPLCAGAYMAKAAGYMTKANGQNDQGEVIGNRYGISKRARAPEWYTIGEYELGLMGGVIHDLFNAVEKKHGDKFAKRRELNQKNSELIALEAKEKNRTGKTLFWVKAKREKIGKELAKVRAQITAMPVRASKYQTVLKTHMLPWFLGRALAMGWKPNKRPDSQELARFKRSQHRRQRMRDASTNSQIIAMTEQTQDRKEETLAASAEFFDEAAKGWCFLDQDDWRSNYGSA